MIPEPDPNKKLEENLKEDGEFLRDVDKGMSSTETGFKIDLGTVRDAPIEEHAEVIQEMQEVSEPPAATDSPLIELPPEPPSAPEPPMPDTSSPADHAETMAEMQSLEPAPSAAEPAVTPTTPSAPVAPATPAPPVPRQPPPSPTVQVEHAETLEEMESIEPETETDTETPDQPPATPPTAESSSAPQRTRPNVSQIASEHGEAIVGLGNTIRRERTPDERPVPMTADPAELERLTFPREQHQAEVRGAMEGNLREDREWKAAVADLFWKMAEMHRQHRLELDLIRGYLERIDL